MKMGPGDQLCSPTKQRYKTAEGTVSAHRFSSVDERSPSPSCNLETLAQVACTKGEGDSGQTRRSFFDQPDAHADAMLTDSTEHATEIPQPPLLGLPTVVEPRGRGEFVQRMSWQSSPTKNVDIQNVVSSGINAPTQPVSVDRLMKQEHKQSRATRRGPMDEMRQLIRILAKMMPTSQSNLLIGDESGGGNRISEEQIKRYLDATLGEAPKPAWGLPDGWGQYLADLFNWAARGSAITADMARKCAKRETGRPWEAVWGQLHSLGLFPDSWPLPLTQNGVWKAQAEGSHTAKADKIQPAVPHQWRAPVKRPLATLSESPGRLNPSRDVPKRARTHKSAPTPTASNSILCLTPIGSPAATLQPAIRPPMLSAAQLHAADSAQLCQVALDVVQELAHRTVTTAALSTLAACQTALSQLLQRTVNALAAASQPEAGQGLASRSAPARSDAAGTGTGGTPTPPASELKSAVTAAVAGALQQLVGPAVQQAVRDAAGVGKCLREGHEDAGGHEGRCAPAPAVNAARSAVQLFVPALEPRQRIAEAAGRPDGGCTSAGDRCAAADRTGRADDPRDDDFGGLDTGSQPCSFSLGSQPAHDAIGALALGGDGMSQDQLLGSQGPFGWYKGDGIDFLSSQGAGSQSALPAGLPEVPQSQPD